MFVWSPVPYAVVEQIFSADGQRECRLLQGRHRYYRYEEWRLETGADGAPVWTPWNAFPSLHPTIEEALYWGAFAMPWLREVREIKDLKLL